MADQASVRSGIPEAASDGKSNGAPEKRVVSGIAEFGNDIATLVELQAKLALLDSKECLEKAMVPVVLVVIALFAILGALPVLLFGIAELVASALKIGIGWALLLTSAVTLVLAGTVAAVSALRIGPSFSSFRRSREEFARNVAWIRTVLLYSGRNVPRRVR